jgi:hypothetical protein
MWIVQRIEIGFCLTPGNAQFHGVVFKPFEKSFKHLLVGSAFPHRFNAVRIACLRWNEREAQPIAAPPDNARLDSDRIVEVFPGAVCSL